MIDHTATFINTNYFEDTTIKSSLLFSVRDINSPTPNITDSVGFTNWQY